MLFEVFLDYSGIATADVTLTGLKLFDSYERPMLHQIFGGALSHDIDWILDFAFILTGVLSFETRGKKASVLQNRTSGIHGGYRLVSTYDLPDSKPLGGGISE